MTPLTGEGVSVSIVPAEIGEARHVTLWYAERPTTRSDLPAPRVRRQHRLPRRGTQVDPEPSGRGRNNVVRREEGRSQTTELPASYRPAAGWDTDCVFSRTRSTSATLHACATHPRGVYGGSASKISLMEPTPGQLRLETSEERASRAVLGVQLQPRVTRGRSAPYGSLMVGASRDRSLRHSGPVVRMAGASDRRLLASPGGSA